MNNNSEAKDQKPQGKAWKVIKTVANVLINVLIVIVLLTSVLIAVLSLTSKNDANGIPNIFGYTFQYVQTNSMNVEPPEGYEGGNFSDEDVIISKVYNQKDFPELSVGDIITYRSRHTTKDGDIMMITHRIVDIREVDGSKEYRTKGDAGTEFDQDEGNYFGSDSIASVYYSDNYHGITLKGFADFFRTLRSQEGFFGFILIPMILFFLYAIVRVVISTMNYKKEKSDEEKETAEKEKQEAVAAAVAAALAEKNNSETKPEDMTPEQMEEFKKFLEFKKAQEAQESPAPEKEE